MAVLLNCHDFLPCFFFLANEIFEKVASQGLLANMIIYLKEEYHMTAATGTNVLFMWSALSNFIPIFGAFLSDSYLGRFRVIALGSLVSLAVSKLSHPFTSLVWSFYSVSLGRRNFKLWDFNDWILLMSCVFGWREWSFYGLVPCSQEPGLQIATVLLATVMPQVHLSLLSCFPRSPLCLLVLVASDLVP